MSSWKNWRHVTKLDPDKVLHSEAVEEIASSGTDALILSGTLDVTPEKLSSLFDMVKDVGLPLAVEPAEPSGARFDGFDYVFVPSVFNSQKTEFITGLHADWIENYEIDWSKVVAEAYVVLNPSSSVAKLTNAKCDLTLEAAASYAVFAEKYFSMPVFYVEYSGTFGDSEIVKACSEVLSSTKLFYGGGIDCGEKAAMMSEFADTIVVGNAVYEKGASVLKETVDAVI
ncbi:MAG: phosphoglycerol geranylgeranyltransferase [Methanocorpusculum sp.]|nr:phosphoglycerol geranylgeranyltransferase [Methanocorpusculum sp.]